MKNISVLLVLLFLSGCFKFEPAKEAVISPGNDPLVNLLYKQLLTSNKIEYTINKDGYYISNKSNIKVMERLTKEAHDQLQSTTEIDLISNCVADKVKHMMQGEVFIINKTQNGQFLKAAASTFEQNKVTAMVSSAQSQCQNNV